MVPTRSYTIFVYGGQSDFVCALESFQNSTAGISISTLKVDAVRTSETSETFRTLIRPQNRKVKRTMYRVVRQFLQFFLIARQKESLSATLLLHTQLVE
jgi:hypothetical protein